jgi:transcriptional antiterminator NusG
MPVVADTETNDGPSGEVRPEGTQWYVIHTYSGYENKVKQYLEQRILSMDVVDKVFRVVVPTEEEVEVKNGVRRTVQRKVYPGYVLVEMVIDAQSWEVVRRTQGVTSFVGTSSNDATPLQESEVQAILRKMVEEKPQVRITFNRGDRVKIIDGPFSEVLGLVDEVNAEKTKLRVLVSMFGREAPVELDFLQVEKQ